MAAMTFVAKKRDQIRYSLIGLACLFIIGITDYLGFFQGMNSYVYDLCFRLRGPETPSDQIVIAAIDEKTLEQLGRWPIARHHYSTFLGRVSNASATVFDIILAEPSPDDLQLADAIAKNRATVLPIYIDHRQHLVLPSPLLRKTPVGHIHIEPSVDGVSRDIFHTLTLDGKQLSSISTVVHGLVSPCDKKNVSSSIPGQVHKTMSALSSRTGCELIFMAQGGPLTTCLFQMLSRTNFQDRFLIIKSF